MQIQQAIERIGSDKAGLGPVCKQLIQAIN